MSMLPAAVAAAFTTADFTADGVAAALGPVPVAALAREQTVPALAASAHGRPVDALIRLFILGVAVPCHDVDAAMPELGAAGLEAAGLVTVTEQRVTPVVEISPLAVDGQDRGWIVSDLSEVATGAVLRPDHVLGVGGASTTLLDVTIPLRCEAVLDLGTGCGVQGMLARGHAERVVATDVSDRALGYARINAALQDAIADAPLAPIEFRLGGMWSPVAREPHAFDLVVSNPPFVVTPRDGSPGYTYRDGGLHGDDLVRLLVGTVDRVLAPGGVAQFLGNWVHVAGQDWRDRLTGWLRDPVRWPADAGGDWDVEGAGDRVLLDAWIVQREVLDPAEYAETWLRDGGLTPDRDRDGYERAYRAYLDYFAAQNVEAIGFGYVVLRRPRGPEPTMLRIEELTGPVTMPIGGHIAQVLAANDLLAAMPDSELASRRPVRASDVTEERFYTPGDDDPSVILIRQGGGFGRSVRADTMLSALVGVATGELSFAQIAAALAGLLGVDADHTLAELLAQARPLVIDGFLTLG